MHHPTDRGIREHDEETEDLGEPALIAGDELGDEYEPQKGALEPPARDQTRALPAGEACGEGWPVVTRARHKEQDHDHEGDDGEDRLVLRELAPEVVVRRRLPHSTS